MLRQDQISSDMLRKLIFFSIMAKGKEELFFKIYSIPASPTHQPLNSGLPPTKNSFRSGDHICNFGFSWAVFSLAGYM
jgi:hypothetical protein